MIEEISIEQLMQHKDEYIILDTRTPAEFEKGHFPNAHNLPLLNNEERVQVGTTYKQVGREEAILLGLDLTGTKWRSFIEKALQIAPKKKVVVYCWRGGMRSGIMSWILNLYGFEVIKLNGGYKAYRNWVLAQFEKPYPIIVLGGMTGSHKTEVLAEFKKRGEQVVDLEDLAQHLGSSYGSMNRLVQPTQEMFENRLAHELYLLDIAQRIWFEDESRTIGTKVIPQTIFNSMRENTVVLLDIDKEQRIDFLVDEYCVLDKEFLLKATERIAKRLGPEQTKMAINALQENDMRMFINLVLAYYDKAYSRGLEKRDQNKIVNISVDYKNVEQCAEEILLQLNDKEQYEQR